MDNETKPWSQLQGEPNIWFGRFEMYRLAGPERSILAVYTQWRDARDSKRSKSTAKYREVPRNSSITWRRAAETWRWRERAEAWDKELIRQTAADAEAERKKILSSGFALRHQRVDKLSQLAELLLEEINDQDKRWLSDVKNVAGKQVDIVRFNASLIKQFRGTLDDLAKEMGERIKNIDLKSGGEPIEIIVKYVDADNDHDSEAAQ